MMHSTHLHDSYSTCDLIADAFNIHSKQKDQIYKAISSFDIFLFHRKRKFCRQKTFLDKFRWVQFLKKASDNITLPHRFDRFILRVGTRFDCATIIITFGVVVFRVSRNIAQFRHPFLFCALVLGHSGSGRVWWWIGSNKWDDASSSGSDRELVSFSSETGATEGCCTRVHHHLNIGLPASESEPLEIRRPRCAPALYRKNWHCEENLTTARHIVIDPAEFGFWFSCRNLAILSGQYLWCTARVAYLLIYTTPLSSCSSIARFKGPPTFQNVNINNVCIECAFVCFSNVAFTRPSRWKQHLLLL